MATCFRCGKHIEGIPWRCRCGKVFCNDHRLPKSHNCPLIPYLQNPNQKETTNRRRNASLRFQKHSPRPYRSKSSMTLVKNMIKTILIIGICFILASFVYGIIAGFSSSSEIGITESTSTSSSGATILQTPTPVPTTIDLQSSFRKNPKTLSYRYYLDGTKSISFTTYGGLAEYLSKEDHTYRYDPVNEVIMELLRNSYQDEYLEQFIEGIKRTSSNSDTQAKVAISLVQHIPYDWNRFYKVGSDWLYPYETLYLNKGVCSDKSLLLSYLLNRLGYDTVLFEFPDHMAVGVKCDSRYDFYDTGYAFIETTRPTIITYVPEEYIGGFKITTAPKVIHLSGGTKSLDVSSEFRDAEEYRRLLAMGSVLDQYHYNRWLVISNKYDLQYET